MNNQSPQLTQYQIETLKFIAAKYCIGTISTNAIKSFINQWMNYGIYIDEFIDVLEAEDTHDIFSVLFNKMLNRLSIETSDKDKAAWIIVAHYMNEIVGESVDPILSLQNCMFDLNNYNDFYTNDNTKYLGETHGIQSLIGMFYGYEDMLEYPKIMCNGKSGPEGIKELKSEIKKEAQNWLQKYNLL